MSDYLKAKAQLDEAQRQLDHTVIYAPFDGIVTQVDQVQPGMYLAASTAAFGLVSTEHVWIEANPKETELTYVKPGDPVEVTVDTYPGRTWKGEVESIAPNSGSEFSVLPAQNTSGNWVKVVQRIPVRIRVDRQPDDPDAARRHERRVADIDTGHATLARLWRDLTLAASRAGLRNVPAARRRRSVPHRALITACTVGATLMQALDQTIANVALPYMQGSLSATTDEITWVLTSYIIAAAIMTAPVGWLAARFGRKYLFITCLVGFTVTSMLCGAAQSLPQMVVFRLLQGVFGAALVPLSQATMMDIYPIEQRGQAMAIWGIGRDGRADPGPDARRLPDRDVQLALRLLHQPAVRHAGHARAAVLHAARRIPTSTCASTGSASRVLSLGIGGVADDARPRPGPGLVQLARDHRRGACWAASASICSSCTC